jgi:hypothetical protein
MFLTKPLLSSECLLPQHERAMLLSIDDLRLGSRARRTSWTSRNVHIGRAGRPQRRIGDGWRRNYEDMIIPLKPVLLRQNLLLSTRMSCTENE